MKRVLYAIGYAIFPIHFIQSWMSLVDLADCKIITEAGYRRMAEMRKQRAEKMSGYNMIDSPSWEGIITSQKFELGSYDWFLINMQEILQLEDPGEMLRFAKKEYKKKHNLTEGEYLEMNRKIANHRFKVVDDFLKNKKNRYD